MEPICAPEYANIVDNNVPTLVYKAISCYVISGIAAIVTLIPLAELASLSQAVQQRYYSVWGSDGMLMFSSQRGCFVNLRGSCVANVKRINHFMVEFNGDFYCAESSTPFLNGTPLDPYNPYGKITTCTPKGWKNI